MKLLAIFGGMLIAVMVALNSELSRSYPPFLAVFIFNITGLVAITIYNLARKSDFRRFKNRIPVYYFLPGIFSIMLTFLNNICIVEIGVSATLALAIAGQAIFSAVVDSLGLLAIKKVPFDKRKLTGFVMITAGIACLVLL